MSKNPDNDKLQALGERLDKARKVEEKKAPKPKTKGDRSMARAYKVGIELMVAMFVSLAAGFFLDKYLETTPLFIIIFFLLGVAAGFRNVYKAAQMMGNQSSSDEENQG